MFNDSAIKKTGQLWKGVVSGALALLGVLTMLAGVAILDGERPTSFIAVITGIILGILGIVIAFIGIRCPKCGAPWVWLAVRSQHAGAWLTWLMSQDRCPRCNNL